MSAKLSFPDINKFVTKLKKEIPNAVRFAAANTLTRLAYQGVVKAERQIKKKMITRNKYTVGNKPGQKGVKYNKAKPRRNMNLIFSEFGSDTDRKYLERQEGGFKDKGTVPTKAVRTSKSYNKVTRKQAYFNKMKVRNLSDYKGKGVGKLKRTRAMLYMAYKAGFGLPNSSNFFSIGNNQYHGFKKGLYQFTTKQARKSNAYPGLKKMYYGKGTTNPTRHGKHWMRDTLKSFDQNHIDQIFIQESEKQLKRYGLI